MARKSRIVSAAKSSKRPRRTRTPIPEPFRLIAPATVTTSPDAKVPMLVLCGEWLAAVGFPIGSAAYPTTDQQGEIRLTRLGLRLPSRLIIRSTPR